jgi:hypothetical protein
MVAAVDQRTQGGTLLWFPHDVIYTSALWPCAEPNMLDLACGLRVPCTALVAQHGSMIGVDLSTNQSNWRAKSSVTRVSGPCGADVPVTELAALMESVVWIKSLPLRIAKRSLRSA